MWTALGRSIGRCSERPPDGRERSSAWNTKTQLLVRRRAASARVDLSGRSPPRHHPKATARRAGQRRRATARRERSHAQARPLLRAGRAWRAPTRCPVRAPWHMSRQQSASTVSARCGFIACIDRLLTFTMRRPYWSPTWCGARSDRALRSVPTYVGKLRSVALLCPAYVAALAAGPHGCALACQAPF